MNLTPELTAAMLTVWERRSRDPQGTTYDCSVLDAACGAPDHFRSREIPDFQKTRPGGRWRRVVPSIRMRQRGGRFR